MLKEWEIREDGSVTRAVLQDASGRTWFVASNRVSLYAPALVSKDEKKGRGWAPGKKKVIKGKDTKDYVEGDELEESRKWFKERMEYMFGYPVDARIASRLHTWWLKVMFDPVTFATEPEEVQPLTVLINWDIVFRMVNRPVIFAHVLVTILFLEP
jgi:hypothetical protein